MNTAADLNAEARRIRHAELSARRLVLEREMEAAPYCKVGTVWWDERLAEIEFIKYRLTK